MIRWAITGLMIIAAPAYVTAGGVELLVSDSTEGEGEAEATADTTPRTTTSMTLDDEDEPSSAPIPSGFDDKLAFGHSLYMKGDFKGALNVYNQAKAMKSSDPLVLYFIASAEAKLGHFDEAITALQAMKTLTGEKIASLTARALFLTALVEETRQNDDNTVKAWQAYKEFVTAHSGIPGFVGAADARLSAFEKKRQLYEQYEVVRQRITAAAK
jgi:tetratricopeptide (TPR) repeat protein